jgi:hypothetical protein
VKDDGGGDDGARQTPAADLVDAGDVDETGASQRVLERAHRRNANHGRVDVRQ